MYTVKLEIDLIAINCTVNWLFSWLIIPKN